MPVDTSMYGHQPKPINPLEMMNSAASTANLMGQNRLLQAQIGLGKHYSGAVDPHTGAVDTNKLLSSVSSDPMTAPATGDAVKLSNELNQPMQTYDASGRGSYITRQELQRKLNLPQMSQAQIDNTHTRFDSMESAATSLIQKPDLSLKDIVSATGNLVAEGHITPQEAATEFANMPSGPNGGPPTQEQLRQSLAEKLQKINSTKATYSAVYGGKSPPPDQQTDQQQPGQQQPQESDQQPSPPPQQAPDQQRQEVLSAPPPGVVEAAATTAQGAAKALNDLHDQVGGSASRLFVLKKALTGLQGTPTGPGTETTNDIKSFLLAQAPDMLKQHLPGVDINEIKSRDEADKYLTQYAIGQASSLGAGTDSKLATTLTGNASTHISNLAAQDVVKANIGLERMQQAQAQAFDQSGVPPQDFNKWRTQWNKEIDPRVFIVDQLSPDQQAKMLKSLKPGTNEYKNFEKHYNWAVQSGFLDDLGAQ